MVIVVVVGRGGGKVEGWGVRDGHCGGGWWRGDVGGQGWSLWWWLVEGGEGRGAGGQGWSLWWWLVEGGEGRGAGGQGWSLWWWLVEGGGR